MNARDETTPPSYPRIPHLLPGRGTSDDLVLSASERAALLHNPVIVEEKLDGSNVMMWWRDGWFECAGRSGPGALDRARQLGPLRAWAAEHAEQLGPILAGGSVLYAEWLILTHSVAYDRLPSYLVVLDIGRPAGGFATTDERNAIATAVGLATPPELLRGVVHSVEHLDEIVAARSRVGSAPMEGAVLRNDGGDPRIAKHLAPQFVQATDDAWRGGRPHNRLASSGADSGAWG